jgi:hypothetical protein
MPQFKITVAHPLKKTKQKNMALADFQFFGCTEKIGY